MRKRASRIRITGSRIQFSGLAANQFMAGALSDQDLEETFTRRGEDGTDWMAAVIAERISRAERRNAATAEGGAQ